MNMAYGCYGELCTDRDSGDHYVEVRERETGTVLLKGPKRKDSERAKRAAVKALAGRIRDMNDVMMCMLEETLID